MAHTFTETVGIITGTIAYLEEQANIDRLATKDFNAAPHVARLTAKLKAVNKLNTEQENAKVALKKKTKDLDTASEDAYLDASGLIDSIAGHLGKTTSEAKNVLAIRSRVRKAGGAAPAPPTPPTA